MNDIDPQPQDENARLHRRLAREHKARLEAEATAEHGLRVLFDRQRQLELLQAVATAANESPTPTEALQVALKLLCEFTGWPVGHALVPATAVTELVSTGLWHLQHPERFAEFQALTAGSRFAPGVGLPGRVWRKGRAVWVVDVLEDGNFSRLEAARNCGMHGAFAFPVLLGQEVCAVLEFFAQDVTEPDETLLSLVAQIGVQLGRVYERTEAAAAVQAARDQLEQRVRQRTAELDQANLQITASERRYRQVLHNLREVVFQTDANGAWTLLNLAWTEITGYSMEESLGRCYADFLHPDDLETGLKIFPPLLTGQTDSCRLEVRLITRTGEARWVQLHARTQHGEAGECNGAAGIIADVTERHAAELALRAANEGLARAARLKDEFLAAMSHELRTPLNAVLGFSEVLMEGVHGAMNEKQLRALTNIADSGRHLLSLINDILDLSKIEAGKERLMLDTIFVDSLCQTSLQFVRTQAAKRNLRLSLQLDPGLETLRGDERRLRQVLVNLLTNAVKFTPEGGHVGLEAKLAADGQHLCFTVTDTGIGISEANQTKLFHPFVQLDSKLSRQYSGTGLGLSLVQRLVELHGGHVTLESTLGQGSRFTVTLPCQPVEPPSPTTPELPAPAPAVVPLAAPVAAASRPVVLLAEDNPMNRETIVTYLTAKGFCLVTAKDGEEAVLLAQAIHPAVILMDIQMPGMDGLEATSILKGRPETARTPIIALTALAMSGDRERCLAAGADDYMSKPVNLRELAATVTRHINATR